MTHVKLIRRRSGFANVQDAFSVCEPGFEDVVDEFCEELAVYLLPAGYTVAKAETGETHIFAEHAKFACEILMHNSGRPQLWTADRTHAPVLTRTQEDSA